MPCQDKYRALKRGQFVPICVKEAYWMRIHDDYKLSGLGELRRLSPVFERGLLAGHQLLPYYSKQCKNPKKAWYQLTINGQRRRVDLGLLLKTYIGFEPELHRGYFEWLIARARRHNAKKETKLTKYRKACLAKLDMIQADKRIVFVPIKMTSGIVEDDNEFYQEKRV